MHQPLSELNVADSTFLTFVCCADDFEQYLAELKRQHPKAAHIPYATAGDRWDDDAEPEPALIGQSLSNELKYYKKQLRRQSTMKSSGSHKGETLLNSGGDEIMACGGTTVANALIVVRYFGTQLLGVTCGRLQSLYIRAARLALHRQLHGLNKPFLETYQFEEKESWKNIYGLGAGDTELILDVICDDNGDNSESIIQKLMNELRWEGMVGSNNEILPRLQNLQADLPIVGDDVDDILTPIYRYPGNYSGTEWPTHPWSPSTFAIKESVEKALQPLYNQKMNHCVANLYRNGSDRIDRHSDKDLDLNRNGVIVSVSLGSTRVMELRDRKTHDVATIELPEGSMFVLGPYTNARFTHAVLPAYEVDSQHKNSTAEPTCQTEEGGRISLTLRDVRTFLDTKTQRLFGQGISFSCSGPTLTEEELYQAILEVRDLDSAERKRTIAVAFTIGLGAGIASSNSTRQKGNSDIVGVIKAAAVQTISAVASYFFLRSFRSRIRQHRDEMEARDFFSKKSASGNKYN